MRCPWGVLAHTCEVCWARSLSVFRPGGCPRGELRLNTISHEHLCDVFTSLPVAWKCIQMKDLELSEGEWDRWMNIFYLLSSSRTSFWPSPTSFWENNPRFFPRVWFFVRIQTSTHSVSVIWANKIRQRIDSGIDRGSHFTPLVLFPSFFWQQGIPSTPVFRALFTRRVGGASVWKCDLTVVAVGHWFFLFCDTTCFCG
jgi:hypothetical protein